MAILEPLRQHLGTRLLGSAEPDEVGLSAERLARLSAAFQREIDRKRLPGVVALVARRGKIAYCESLGVRDPASGALMLPDAIFRIYSMTKPIVSVAVMMLVEQGQLLLVDPLHKFLTAFSEMKVARYRDRGDVRVYWHRPGACTVQHGKDLSPRSDQRRTCRDACRTALGVSAGDPLG